MNGKNDKVWLLATILILVLCGGLPWMVTRAATGAQGAKLSDAVHDKILTYIRERFGVPDTVKLVMGPLHASAVAPDFQEATVIAGEGKEQRAQLLLVSDDSRYLVVVLGSIMELHQSTNAEMVERIQETFKTPPTLKLTVGGFKPSPSPDFRQGTLTLDDGRTPRQEKEILLSRDGKHLIVSEMFNLGIDPRQLALHTISLRDEPTQGPADAPVTIVEYADLECPTCARMHDFLETKVVPRYGNKLRIVFKEFPLAMHDWSMNAAIACQCAYEINPASYVPLRSTIFRNQTLINITNLRESLLSYGEEVGVNRVRLAGCLDAKSSRPRVQRDMDEAKRIEVNQTPTVYINGRMLVGFPSEDAYFQAIDEALKGGRQ